MAATAASVFQPDRSWWECLFATVDARDAAGFVTFLTPDAEFRFGNAPAMVGSDAIAAGVSGFFAAIGSSRHELRATWTGTASAACEGTVTYTRHNGSAVSYPFANVFEFRGTKISAYRIYIDNASLFSETT